jgi:hypothetical protein
VRVWPRAVKPVKGSALDIPSLDQNLSHRLIDRLRDVYADIAHVRAVGLGRADDQAVWEYPAGQGFIVVTKDSDFNTRAFVRAAAAGCLDSARQLPRRRCRGATQRPICRTSWISTRRLKRVYCFSNSGVV